MRKPPTTGPIASARADTPAQVPIALPRSCGSKTLVTIESVAGIMNAAPTPCTTRLAISEAESDATPAVAEETANSVTPIRNPRRRPKMSPSLPPVASRTAKLSVYALTVHSRLERLEWRSR